MEKVYKIETFVDLDEQHDGQRITVLTNVKTNEAKYAFEGPVPTPQGFQTATIIIEEATSLEDAFAKLPEAQEKYMKEVETFMAKQRLMSGVKGVNPNDLKLA